MKKLLILIACLSIFLTGCTSQEAKEVISDIDSLGEITLDSFEMLQLVNDKYNALSEEEKADISNIAILNAANQRFNELKYADLDSRIELACNEISADNLGLLNELLQEYENLSDSGKASISNISLLEDSIVKCTELKAKEVTSTIKKKANGSTREAKELLIENAAIMTDKQIESCLIEIGRWSFVGHAESYFQTMLKNPYSYKRYSGSCGTPELQDDGTYKTLIHLDYGATNSFNAMVRDEVELYVYFTINTETLTVSYEDTTLTLYYAWKFS